MQYFCHLVEVKVNYIIITEICCQCILVYFGFFLGVFKAQFSLLHLNILFSTSWSHLFIYLF